LIHIFLSSYHGFDVDTWDVINRGINQRRDELGMKHLVSAAENNTGRRGLSSGKRLHFANLNMAIYPKNSDFTIIYPYIAYHSMVDLSSSFVVNVAHKCLPEDDHERIVHRHFRPTRSCWDESPPTETRHVRRGTSCHKMYHLVMTNIAM